MGQAVKQDIKVLLESKPKFLLVHSSSGHKQALKEVLSHPSVTVRLADTKVRREGGRDPVNSRLSYCTIVVK